MLIPVVEITKRPDDRPEGAYHPVHDQNLLMDKVARWGRLGDVLIMDRDAEDGHGDNEDLIRRLVKLAPCRVQGGIASEDQANSWVRAGIHRLVLDADSTPDLLARLPRRHLLARLTYPDTTEGDGIGHRTRALVEAIQVLAPQVSGFVCVTAGSLDAINESMARQLSRATPQPITLAVNKASVADLVRFDRLGFDVACPVHNIAPAATPEDVLLATVDFSAGPLATIVSDQYGQVLMLARSSRETLVRTFASGRCVFSDNDQTDHVLVRLRMNCRRDALWFTVTPHGRSCRRNTHSCFGDGAPEFGLARLFDVIRDRREHPLPGSYTSFLFEKDDRLPRKLNEEIYELLTAPTHENLVWESADVLYFYLAFLAQKGVSLDEVVTELRGREQ